MKIDRIWHVSDLHERSDPAHNAIVRDRLDKVRAAWNPEGDLLIATGDLTDDGKEAQYAQALEHLRPFAGRIVICPGNHDYGPLGNFYDAAAVKRFAKLRATLGAHVALDAGSVRVLALDTCLRTANPFDFARGRIGRWQGWRIRWFCAAARRAGALPVVAMHHTPFDTSWALRLVDADRLLREAEGRAALVLVGHEHKERRVRHHRDGDRADRTLWISAPSLAQASAQPIVLLPGADFTAPWGTP